MDPDWIEDVWILWENGGYSSNRYVIVYQRVCIMYHNHTLLIWYHIFHIMIISWHLTNQNHQTQIQVPKMEATTHWFPQRTTQALLINFVRCSILTRINFKAKVQSAKWSPNAKWLIVAWSKKRAPGPWLFGECVGDYKYYKGIIYIYIYIQLGLYGI